MLTTIAGIPAHPLFVHLAVVAVPVASLLAIVAAVRFNPERHLLRLWTMILSAVSVVAVIVARSSGEAMLPGMGLSEENPGKVTEHAQWATYGLVVTGLLFLVSAALWFFPWRASRRNATRLGALAIVVRVVAIIIALVALYVVVQTGHEGALLVWKED